jgi:hypothetical protein
MFQKLASLASKLDTSGLHYQADQLDDLLKTAADQEAIDNIKILLEQLEEVNAKRTQAWAEYDDMFKQLQKARFLELAKVDQPKGHTEWDEAIARIPAIERQIEQNDLTQTQLQEQGTTLQEQIRTITSYSDNDLIPEYFTDNFLHYLEDYNPTIETKTSASFRVDLPEAGLSLLVKQHYARDDNTNSAIKGKILLPEEPFTVSINKIEKPFDPPLAYINFPVGSSQDPNTYDKIQDKIEQIIMETKGV